MGQTKHDIKPLETIWEVLGHLWCRIEPMQPEEHGGWPRIDFRAAFNGIIFRLRSGCQQNRLPEEFGDDSSVQRWCKSGVFKKVWAVLVEECNELGAVEWKWEMVDGMLGKAHSEIVS